jgi:acetyl esterase/lipase
MKRYLLKHMCGSFLLAVMTFFGTIDLCSAQSNIIPASTQQNTFRQRQELLRGRMQNDITLKTDISYTDVPDRLQTLDIYYPAPHENPEPILMHIHGGGWSTGDKRMMRHHGLFYAGHGIVFIAINYHLSPKVQHPVHIQDCAAAFAWVYAHAEEMGGDRNRIFVSGHSAGAHLAALLGTNSTYLQQYNISPTALAGVIGVDAVSYDLLTPTSEKLNKRFIIQAFGTDHRILRSASPYYNVVDHQSYPQFLLLNTSVRMEAAVAAKRFADKLHNVHCAAQIVVVGGHTHEEMNSAMYDESDTVSREILRFILK